MMAVNGGKNMGKGTVTPYEHIFGLAMHPPVTSVSDIRKANTASEMDAIMADPVIHRKLVKLGEVGSPGLFQTTRDHTHPTTAAAGGNREDKIGDDGKDGDDESNYSDSSEKKAKPKSSKKQGAARNLFGYSEKSGEFEAIRERVPITFEQALERASTTADPEL
jgi:hypothetical protein